jgi:hypothetical protein
VAQVLLELVTRSRCQCFTLRAAVDEPTGRATSPTNLDIGGQRWLAEPDAVSPPPRSPSRPPPAPARPGPGERPSLQSSGARPPARGETLPCAKAELIRRVIAEHASRMIFAADPDPEVPALRPRIVDAAAFREELKHWQRWHHEQTAAERKVRGGG